MKEKVSLTVLDRLVLGLLLSVGVLEKPGSGDTARLEPMVVQRWHVVELQLEGPETSETATPNPFTDIRLDVSFQHESGEKRIRGFYAADGNAAKSGASSGNIWKVRFTPEEVGEWTYTASFRSGEDIALAESNDEGQVLQEFSGSTGSIQVIAQDKSATSDFRQRGFLIADAGFFKFRHNQRLWLKGGCGSPENLLAFKDFDDTYRIKAESRAGEATATEQVHAYAAHLRDWRSGDPTWKENLGKGLIGGINYLADQGVNSIYFLTMNIGGDGKDVWPYLSPTNRDRFDCSKLDQWEIVFEHMQRRGIALHVVTQETENEKMLDDGETGRMRKLYYDELIARFAHHPAVIWNLGEENGPADFSPNGQTNAQQRAMASYLDARDPYDHPIVIHTHSTKQSKDDILPGLLGHAPLDGLSFQVNQPPRVHEEVGSWIQQSDAAGRRWLIAMDEIGKWDTGVVPDSVDPDHDDLRREVLWGALMAGAAGVEWYFGANYPHNDLTCEDWRQRENMWKQTAIAVRFFDEHTPFSKMRPMPALVSNERAYCFARPGDTYVVYLESEASTTVTLPAGSYDVNWFDPKHGGQLQLGSITQANGPADVHLGEPPSDKPQDWVVLIRPSKK